MFLTVDYGSWFDYTLDWEKVFNDNPDYPFHVMSYEDMKTVSISLGTSRLCSPHYMYEYNGQWWY